MVIVQSGLFPLVCHSLWPYDGDHSCMIRLYDMSLTPHSQRAFCSSCSKVSTTIKYEKKIKTYMIIAGCGVLLIFSANQGEAQITGPYPPFRVATMTVLNTAAFLMLIGIYNSAVLVSVNNDLRKSIYKYALGSNLLGQIGRSEMEIELQKAVTKITKEKEHLMTKRKEEPIELDGMELKKYLEFVIHEVKKDKKQ